MDDYTAVGIAEGFIDCESKEQFVTAWQHLIDTGACWNLQGWFGRTAAELLVKGVVEPTTPTAKKVFERELKSLDLTKAEWEEKIKTVAKKPEKSAKVLQPSVDKYIKDNIN